MRGMERASLMCCWSELHYFVMVFDVLWIECVPDARMQRLQYWARHWEKDKKHMWGRIAGTSMIHTTHETRLR